MAAAYAAGTPCEKARYANVYDVRYPESVRRLVPAVWMALSIGACRFDPGELAIAGDAAPGVMADGATSADGASGGDAAPADFHLRIEAFIDGESHLYIKGNTVHWKHFIYAAPGRWDADGAAPFTIRPIVLNSVDWLPTWPDAPTPENRICTAYPCAGVDSDSTTLPISVPRAPSTATWTEVQTRRAQGIIQAPTAANDYELIVLISDYGVGGAADYIVDVDVTVD